MEVPLMKKKDFITSGEGAIASYDWVELMSGSAFIPHYCTWSADSVSTTNYKLTTKAITPSTNVGYISAGTYLFSTDAAKLPRVLNGTASLTGFVDYSAHNITITAQLYKDGGDTGTLGDIEWTSDAEVSKSGDDTYELKKTLTIGGFVNKATFQLKMNAVATFFGNVYLVFNYGERSAYTQTPVSQVRTETTYTDFSVSNPYPEKYVISILMYMMKNNEGTGKTLYAQNLRAYKQVKTDFVSISSAVTSRTFSGDFSLFMEIPLTARVNIPIGTKIQLLITTTGATGFVVTDPNGVYRTNETLKLNLPTEIDI
jgi:hypothetical protein